MCGAKVVPMCCSSVGVSYDVVSFKGVIGTRGLLADPAEGGVG
jgi:hypothetical protein